MGVTGLWKDISSAKEEIDLGTLSSLRVAVDVSLWLHASLRGSQSYVYNKSINSHISTLFKRTSALLCHAINPIFVFDGLTYGKIRGIHSPSLSEIARIRSCSDALNESKNAVLSNQIVPSDINSNIPLEYNNATIKDNPVYSTSKKLLDLLGVSWVQSEGDAEATCARLEVDGMVSGTITNDSDYFLYGGRTMYDVTFDHTKPIVNVITMDNIHSIFGLTRVNLIQLSLFLGCDFYKGVNKIGFKKGCAIIKHFSHETDTDILQPLERFKLTCILSPAACGNNFAKKMAELVDPESLQDLLKNKHQIFLNKAKSPQIILRKPKVFTDESVKRLSDFLQYKESRVQREINRIRRYEKAGQIRLKNEKQSLITDFMVGSKRSKAIKRSAKLSSLERLSTKKIPAQGPTQFTCKSVPSVLHHLANEAD